MNMTRTEEYREHVEKENGHWSSPLQIYLKEIVYGGIDGIVTTFAVVAGFAGASLGDGVVGYSFLTVLLFGIANLVGDGASMGLGNFLSLRAEQDMYRSQRQRKRYEIGAFRNDKQGETIDILISQGFTEAQASQLVSLYATNENYWLQFLMNHELELSNPLSENPVSTGIATFTAFLFFGFIPLTPFLFVRETNIAFVSSFTATAIALIILGLLRWKVTDGSITRSVLEVVSIGGVAASLAYGVGVLFKEFLF